jgi:hypothetical protein
MHLGSGDAERGSLKDMVGSLLVLPAMLSVKPSGLSRFLMMIVDDDVEDPPHRSVCFVERPSTTPDAT